MTEIGVPGCNVLRPTLIGLLPWLDGRMGLGFGVGHLSQSARIRAQPKAPPHGGMGGLRWWWWVGVRWQQRSPQGQQRSLLVCQHTGQCGVTRWHRDCRGTGGLHTAAPEDRGGEDEACPL